LVGGNLKEEVHMGYLGINGRIISKWLRINPSAQFLNTVMNILVP
jgi:hypothetical protein